MTVTDITDRAQTESLTFELDLAHEPDKVWRALTEPELLARWLLPVVGLELTPGAAFRFESEPQPGWDGIVHCRLREIEAPRRLSYGWIVGDMDTVVTFTLAPTETGTRLRLEQSGFREDQKQNFGGARYGWQLMGGKLVDVLADLP